MKNEIILTGNKIQTISYYFEKDGNGNIVRNSDVNIKSYDIFPSATEQEKEIVVQSANYSISLFKSICQDFEGTSSMLKSHLRHELGYLINSSHSISGIRLRMNLQQIDDVLNRIIKYVLPNSKWLTKSQFTTIMEMGFCKQLTNYNNFSIPNFIDWVEEYRKRVNPVLFKQMQYKGVKRLESYKDSAGAKKTLSSKEILANQMEMFKMLLNNPYIFDKKKLGEKLKDQFKITLQKHLFRTGSNFNLVFDFFIKNELILPKENEIETIAEQKEIQGLVLVNLLAPEHILNKYKLIYAKNEYISQLILDLIEGDKIASFLSKLEEKTN